MLPKPDGCRECPLYGTGKGFVRGKVSPGVRVLLLGPIPDREEVRTGKAFTGKTSTTIETTYLPLAGLTVEEIAVDYVLRCREEKLPKGKGLENAINHCRQFDIVPETVQLIIAQGELALQKMGGKTYKLNEWRGHLLQGD